MISTAGFDADTVKANLFLTTDDFDWVGNAGRAKTYQFKEKSDGGLPPIYATITIMSTVTGNALKFTNPYVISERDVAKDSIYMRVMYTCDPYRVYIPVASLV